MKNCVNLDLWCDNCELNTSAFFWAALEWLRVRKLVLEFLSAPPVHRGDLSTRRLRPAMACSTKMRSMIVSRSILSSCLVLPIHVNRPKTLSMCRSATPAGKAFLPAVYLKAQRGRQNIRSTDRPTTYCKIVYVHTKHSTPFSFYFQWLPLLKATGQIENVGDGHATCKHSEAGVPLPVLVVSPLHALPPKYLTSTFDLQLLFLFKDPTLFPSMIGQKETILRKIHLVPIR